MNFLWDNRKATINLKKHGVSFEEAQSVFLDDYAILLDDPDHSQEEDRFILLGFSSIEAMMKLSALYPQEKPLSTKQQVIGKNHEKRI